MTKSLPLTEPPPLPESRPRLPFAGRSPWDWAVGTVVAVMVAWCVPLFYFGWWTPRFAAMLAFLPLGVVGIARLVRARDAAAIAAALALGWFAVGALVSVDPWLSLKGMATRDYSLVTFIGAIAAWAIGRHLPDSARRTIGPAFGVAMAVNLLVGTIQVTVGIGSGLLQSSPSRASGLVVNPVYFGALSAGLAAYGAVAYRADLPAMAMIAGGWYGVMLSGSRVALSSGSFMLLVSGLVWARRRALASFGKVAAAAALGITAALLVAQYSGGRTSIERFGVGTEGRLELWKLAASSTWDRPFLGTGLGLFRVAVQGRFTTDFARDSTALGRQSWADPHNIVVLMAVSGGIVGLLLVAAFAGLAVRHARGPLLALFVSIATSWLLQPAAILTLPIAMLALGAAANVPRASLCETGRRDAGRRWALMVGACSAAYVCAVDVAFRTSLQSDNETAIELTSELFVRDANAQATVASWHLGQSSERDDAHYSQAIERTRRAAQYEHTRAIRWVQLAELELAAGRLGDARRHLEIALELEPTEVSAWLAMVEVASRSGDTALVDEASSRSCQLIPSCQARVGP